MKQRIGLCIWLRVIMEKRYKKIYYENSDDKKNHIPFSFDIGNRVLYL